MLQGVTFPAMHAMLGAWLPKYERSLLCTIVYSGAQMGTVVAMPLSGILASSRWGWPAVFYLFGGSRLFPLFHFLRFITDPNELENKVASALALNYILFCHNGMNENKINSNVYQQWQCTFPAKEVGLLNEVGLAELATRMPFKEVLLLSSYDTVYSKHYSLDHSVTIGQLSLNST